MGAPTADLLPKIWQHLSEFVGELRTLANKAYPDWGAQAAPGNDPKPVYSRSGISLHPACADAGKAKDS